MTERVARHVASDLIRYCKSCKVFAHGSDPSAKSAVEFANQMMSSKLRKDNPSFTCDFDWHQDMKPAMIYVEFIDGKKWELNASGKSMLDLRYLFYEKASEIEEEMFDRDEDLPDPGEEATGGGAPAKGAAKGKK